jgi:hypothetical protein
MEPRSDPWIPGRARDDGRPGVKLPAGARLQSEMKNFVHALAVALLLSGCASPWGGASIAPGTPREDVIARMGHPTRVVALPDGTQRLQYSLQPAGQFAWMVDLDASGRVTSARQVLNQLDFQRIVPDQWTRADVEREFGPPARVDGVASWTGSVMTYRWRDVQGADMFYWVYLDPQGVVRRAHPGMEFRDRLFDRR